MPEETSILHGSEEFARDLQMTVDHDRQHYGRLLRKGSFASEDQVDQLPVRRGILLQDLTAQGGLAALISVASYPVFRLEVIGRNTIVADPALPKFKIKGMFKGQTLFETNLIDIIQTDSALQGSIIAGSFAVGQGISPSDIHVTLGNPYRDQDLIQAGNVTTDLAGKRSSGIGVWLIHFQGPRFLPGTMQLSLSDTDGHTDVQYLPMNGLTNLRLTRLEEADTLTREIVFDPYYLGEPTPLRAGTMVTLQYFQDRGYGVIGAGPRNLYFQ